MKEIVLKHLGVAGVISYMHAILILCGEKHDFFSHLVFPHLKEGELTKQGKLRLLH